MDSSNSSPARIKEDNTSLLSFFASLFCRLAYEPPILFQLGLIESVKIMNQQKYIEPTFQFLKDVSKSSSQNDFINLLKNTEKMKALAPIAEKINNILYSLKSDIFKAEGLVVPDESSGIDGTESNDLLKASAVDEGKVNLGALPPPASSTDQMGGGKIATFDKLPPTYKEEFLNSLNDDIKTFFIHTSHDFNCYVTAIKSTNSIIVTFRGTQSLKNALADANLVPYKGCNIEKVKAQASKGFFSSISSMSKPSSSIKEFGGVSILLDSVINTLSYSILYLSKNFLNEGKETPEPATVFSFGHSLGGGLCTFFGFEYVGIHDILPKNDKYFLNPNIICISNAAPRVLNKTAMDSFMNLVNQGRIKFLRQWTSGDWVPAVPPQTGGYYHPKVDGVVTTLKLAQTWNTTLPHRVAYDKSLKGKYNAPTGQNVPSITAHCFQTYINFWPVVSGFALGAEVSKKMGVQSDLAQEQKLKTIALKLVLMGNLGKNNIPIKSIVKELAEKSIGENLSAKIDVEVSSYDWFIKNLINRMNDDNSNFPSSVPELTQPLSTTQATDLLTESKNNFATATCLKMQTGGKRKKNKRKSKKKSKRKSKRKSKKIKKKNTKKKKKKSISKKKLNLKGGYSQFLSNVPYSASYSTSDISLSPSNSALANPVPYTRFINCPEN